MDKSVIILAALLITALALNASATEVSGDVWGVWESSMNPIEVVGDLRVPPDSALFIGPGCFVEFQGYYQFVVDTSALFQASGTESDSIFFTGGEFHYQWAGFDFNSADSGSQISYCKIRNCFADSGIYCLNSYLTIENSTFKSPGTDNLISVISSPMTSIVNCVFDSNSNVISSANSNFEITGNLFKNNNNGSIIVVESYSPQMLIKGNVFSNNENSVLISSFAAGVIIEENIIYDNTGVVTWFFLAGDSIIFKGNIVFNNYFSYFEGGVFNCIDTRLIAYNNTICNNSGATRLGYFGEEFIGPSSSLYNNIIWGNTYGGSSPFEHFGITLYLTYSDIQGGWSGTGNIDVNPMFVDTANADFNLMPGSPCIDTGDPSSPLDPDSTRADMGALPFDQTTSIENHNELPTRTALAQNYPNPFNSQTLIAFDLPAGSNVSLEIYDILGKKVATLTDRHYPAGSHEIVWGGISDNGGELSSGIYFYKIKSGSFEQAHKMILLK